jgi:deoxyribonuclease V
MQARLMIAALDVHYDEDTLTGVGAGVVFERWEDNLAIAEYVTQCKGIAAYTPGEFYKRELPCLLAVLQEIAEPLSLVIIDGYVQLGDKPGLGWRLWEALGEKTPIVGVAKTRIRAANAKKVIRGSSTAPLFVTAAGIDVDQAADCIAQMAGPYRIPTLLKRVDRLSREGVRSR